MPRFPWKHFVLISTLAGCNSADLGKQEIFNEKLLGLSMSYDLRPASLPTTRQTMNAFTLAYVKRDRAALAAVLSDDFVWYVHDGIKTAQGEVHHGVDGLLAVLDQRSKDWSGVAYSEIEFHASGDRVFQQFRIKGLDRRTGTAFDTYGIDVYVVRDGKIASKDSYWKRQTR